MVNNLDVGFYKGKLGGELLMHNQAFNKILGVDPSKSFVGITSSQFFANPGKQEQYYNELQERGFVRNFIAQVKKSDGSMATVDLNAHLIDKPEGELKEVEGTFSDITEKFKLEQELKESEKKLRLQNIELKKLDKVKNDFITMAAHELKTPLISISGYTDYILMKYRSQLSSEITDDLSTVQRNVNRLEILMDQLLDVLKIDENELKLHKEILNISKIINNCLDELSYLINEKNLEIVLNIDHEITLHFDKPRIFTVFTNLISNAIKFTPDYGWIEIKAKKLEKEYLFEIKDNGIGLTSEEIKRLFKKFERIKPPLLSDNINIKDSGTGLGLYITRGIITAHGGEIQAHSDGENKGSTFSFTLPL
jgi:PAS domain S-box-containing protein